MRVSVIIVNYNVVYFLEQCLYTVMQAASGLEAEIIVVDNASTDESRSVLPGRYPAVQFIWNDHNPGFGAANNQAMKIARGEYLLLLNPDTLLPPDALQTCLDFFAHHPDAGAVGMRMVDGSGKYLPESKRGFPDPVTAFYKLSGLARLFPRHPKLARYYLGHLNADAVQEVEVLAGAFMMMSRKAYAQVGEFDEAFFMYGEDIDLSHRIRLAGFKNYYLPEPGLIHFKGESTRRDFTYTRHFYEAMLIFARKYSGKKLWLQVLLLEAAIYGFGALAAIKNLWPRAVAPQQESIRWQLIGDPETIRELEAGWPASQNAAPIVTVHALGDSYTIRNVLSAWRQHPPTHPQRFHGKGTGSMVGSDAATSTGMAVQLKKACAI